MLILAALEEQPLALAELVEQTGINRATAHRLASALEAHGILRRVEDGRFALGYRLWNLGQAVPGAADLASRVGPPLDKLRDLTGESSQYYVRDGEERVCLAASESSHGLRTIVAVGARLTLERGSAGAVFLNPDFSTPGATDQLWVASVAEREPGVASVSAPVRDRNGAVVGVVSVSGPIERTTRKPGQRYGADVAGIASEIAAVLPQA